MAKLYPAELTGVLDGDQQSLAPGGRKVEIELFTFTSDGTNPATTDTLSFGYRREGEQVIGFILAASANMSAASLAIGVSGTTAKYKAAATLPNATSTFVPCPSTALDDGPLAAREELIGTITNAAIPAGVLVVGVVYSKQ